MADFPSIGRMVLEGYGEEVTPPVARTEMENGSVKQAQIAAGSLVQVPVTYEFTRAEYATWRTFWRDTLRRGTDWFSWVDPRDGETRDARIVGGAWQSDAWTRADGAPLEWRVRFTLEYWDEDPA